MTWIAPQLDRRVQVLMPTQRPNEAGGFDFGFGVPFGDSFEYGSFGYMAPLLTIWAGLKPVTPGQYIRGEQIGEGVTHEFKIRRGAVASLGRTFGKGFGGGFDSIEDLAPLKTDYFLFLQRSSTVKGRLFRIKNVKDNDERREYLRVQAEELEERGTGYPA